MLLSLWLDKLRPSWMTCLCWLSLSVKCPILAVLLQQEKLSKDIEYLISKESQVKAHITQLDLLLKETEVRVACRLSGVGLCTHRGRNQNCFQ